MSESSSCEHDSSARGEGHVDMQMWIDRGAGKIRVSVTMIPDHNTDAYCCVLLRRMRLESPVHPFRHQRASVCALVLHSVPISISC